ncbi:MAG: hypothetical protein CSA05_01545 [Bacteroidia bacterium]|nr:MAG: hypothetical protein CSB01_01355 [Bacteroidia bacterium]PIE86224.1 MAG: hypothetical protein CSA05_01545 [Bacteroidia bacterium]
MPTKLTNMKNFEKFNLFEYYYRSEHDILVSYKGPFDKHVLTAVGNYIKKVMETNPKVSKKIFKIFIELAQNIAYYSSEKNKLGNEQEAGVGSIVIVEFEDHYSFITGNVVNKDDIIPVIDKCNKINTLDKNGLREYKREMLKLPDSSHGGANIGLIQVAITSDNPLGIDVAPIDDTRAFFAVSAKVDK